MSLSQQLSRALLTPIAMGSILALVVAGVLIGNAIEELALEGVPLFAVLGVGFLIFGTAIVFGGKFPKISYLAIILLSIVLISFGLITGS